MANSPHKASTTTGTLIDPATSGINFGSGNDAASSAANISELQSTISPILQVPDPTLSNTPWYKDTSLVTGNASVRASVVPVSFTVYLDRSHANQFLRNPADNKPIEIQLNTSLSSIEIASKHIYNRTPSRTGMHITLWGMELDLISGAGTTGIFMNQFGITDFLSTTGINDDIIQLLSGGGSTSFTSPFDPDDVTAQNPQLSATQTIQNLKNPNSAFRVAAQDAFIEFLKLFQMNGNIWYYSQNYANGSNLGTIGGTEQVSPTAWSSQVGASSFQQHSRNNDVMSRGFVAMHYRNNIYLGYFKSLSWTQDADNPFQWKYNFTFQVEKTYTALYYSNVQATIQQQNAQLQAITGTPQSPSPPPPTGDE